MYLWKILQNKKSIRKVLVCQIIQPRYLKGISDFDYLVAVAAGMDAGWVPALGGENFREEKKPLPYISGRGSVGRDYFFVEQAQPQPEDFFSSCFSMVPAAAHSGHFFGLHLPSLVAPHFSHLNTAILFSFYILILFQGIAPWAPSPVAIGPRWFPHFHIVEKAASIVENDNHAKWFWQ